MVIFVSVCVTLVGPGMGGAPGEGSVPIGEGITGAANGVWAGVLGSLLLISPAEADPEPTFTPTPARVCWKTHAEITEKLSNESRQLQTLI